MWLARRPASCHARVLSAVARNILHDDPIQNRPTGARKAALSLSKDRIRILLLEGISDTAVAVLQQAGYTSIERLPKAL